jgi:hypothetical protein
MLSAEGYRSCKRYIPITRCLNKENVVDYASKISDVVKGWVSPEFGDDIFYSLSETMDNVFDHAFTDKGLWLHCQKYSKAQCIEIVLIDMGIGISQSLGANPDYAYLSDEDRFNHALELEVSSNPSCHAGEGLSSTLEWLKLNKNVGARGLVISHEFCWFLGKSKFGTVKLGSICWPGTFIWLRIPFSPEKTLVDMWEILGITSDE